MRITPIKTRILQPPRDDLLAVVRESLAELPEQSILAITSKVVGIWQGRCVKKEDVRDKDALIRQEADKFLPREMVPEGRAMLTLKNNILLPTAGVDESNAGDYYILWPENPNAAARELWEFLQKTYGVRQCGVLITDSHSVPLRRGVAGISIGYFGFKPLKDYRGQEDLFGRKFRRSIVNLVDSLAAAAVAIMGEGREQTPLALISEVPDVEFLEEEYKPVDPYISLEVDAKEDLYRPLLEPVPWEKGGK